MKSLHRCVLSSFLVCYWLGHKTSHSPLKVGIAIAEQQTQVATANPGGDRCWVEKPEAWLSPPRANNLWTVYVPSHLLFSLPKFIAVPIKPPQRCREAEKYTIRREERTERATSWHSQPQAFCRKASNPPGSTECPGRLLWNLQFMDLEHVQTKRLRIFPGPEDLGVEVQKGTQVGGMGRQAQKGTSRVTNTDMLSANSSNHK